MQLVARLGDRTERLTVERRAGSYRVRLGDRVYEVETRVLGPFILSLVASGESFETAVHRLGDGRYHVGWRGRDHAVELVDPLTFLAEEARAASGKRGKLQVSAYMPGRVVDVRVAEGQEVAQGQSLVVLEAMKMQNEIQAERAGVVRRVLVAPGQAVEGGDPLVEIE